MDISTKKKLDEGKFIVEISTLSFSNGDTQLMESFGEPVIEVGGTFDDGLGLVFTLPANPRKVKTEFTAVTETFDTADLTELVAHQQANFWAVEVANRIRVAMSTLRGRVDNFTGTTIEPV